MPYFRKDDINILFIHIPKTGGTSLSFYFSSKYKIPLNNDCLFRFIDKKKQFENNIIIDSSLQHITYKQIVEYKKIFNVDFNNIKIITVVRNPYERIVSDLFWFKKIHLNTSKEEVTDIIKTLIKSNELDNHMIPQNVFVTDKNNNLVENLHILRRETLTNDMHELGYEDFNLYMNVNSNKNANNKINYYDYLNNQSIEIINEFYHNDFILFGYLKQITI
jgi:hypothetical protein